MSYPGRLMGAKRTRYERGQVIIIVAVIAIGLVAAMGLAIDGGRLLLLQRDAQNATDAAVLSATLALCSGGTEAQIVTAGEGAASANGFTAGGEDTTVLVDPTPNGAVDCNADCSVQVTISREIPPYFIHVVFDGALAAEVTAVGTCHPDGAGDLGGADGGGLNESELTTLWAGSTECQNTVNGSGSTIKIVGGIHSNNDIFISGQSLNVYGQSTYVTSLDPAGANDKIDWWPYSAVDDEEEDETDVVCGAACAVEEDPEGEDDEEDDDNPAQLDGPYGTDEEPNYPVPYKIEDYRPGGSVATQYDNADASLDRYYDLTAACTAKGGKIDSGYLKDAGYLNDSTKVLDDGIYYAPCKFHLSDSDTTSYVTIVSEDEIDLSGSEHNLAPFHDDLLVFSNLKYNEGNKACTAPVVKMAGSTHKWKGIIYAPYGQVEMSGSSNTSLEGCIAAYTINLNGSSLEITCKPTEGTSQPSFGVEK